MDDSISRRAAIDTVFSMCCRWNTDDPNDLKNMLMTAFQDLPSAEPERKKGKWYTFFSDSYKVHKIGVECSCCGYRTQERTNYCPNCGAEMVKGECE